MYSYKLLTESTFHATDGDIGGCTNILFNDQDFIVRYLVADTNSWLPMSRKVVISPIAVGIVEIERRRIHINMTSDELKESPSIDEHKTVSREYEEVLSRYFGYGYYWIGPGNWGDFAHPTELVDTVSNDDNPEPNNTEQTNHLRECGEISGYSIKTLDKEIGQVEDFIFNRYTWKLELISIDTNRWMPGGRKVVLPTSVVESIDWPNKQIVVSLSKQTVLLHPEFELNRLNDDEYCLQILRQVTSS